MIIYDSKVDVYHCPTDFFIKEGPTKALFYLTRTPYKDCYDIMLCFRLSTILTEVMAYTCDPNTPRRMYVMGAQKDYLQDKVLHNEPLILQNIAYDKIIPGNKVNISFDETLSSVKLLDHLKDADPKETLLKCEKAFFSEDSIDGWEINRREISIYLRQNES